MQNQNDVMKINEAFLSFCDDFGKNIQTLIKVCGELLDADLVLYSRLTNGKIYTVGKWPASPAFKFFDSQNENEYYKLLKKFDLNNLRDFICQNNIGDSRFKLRTCIGYPIVSINEVVGIISVFYKESLVITDNQKNILKIIVRAIAIEEKRKKSHQEDLHQQKKYFEALFSNATDAIVFLDNEKKVVNINDRFTKMFGYKLNEIKGLELDFFVTDEEKEQEAKSLTEAILKGKTFTIETIRYTKKNTPLNVLIKGIPVVVDKKIIGGYVIYVDITEQKNTEKKLAVFAAELELQSIELEDAYIKINEDINKARLLHQQFLPSTFPKIDDISFAAFYQPAEKIGGDFYNYIQVNNHLYFYLVDVTGHGLDGAMLNIFIRETINRYLVSIYKEGKKPSTSDILNYLAQEYCKESFPQDYFISILVGILDIKTKELTFSNAGIQIPPFLVFPDGKLIELNIGGLPISSVLDNSLLFFEERKTVLGAGVTLLLTTDGIVEETIANQMYGENRVKKILLNNYYLPPQILINTLIDDFRAFTDGNQGQDDVTIVALQIKPEIIYENKYICPSDTESLYQIYDTFDKVLKNEFQDIDKLLIGFYEMVENAFEHGNKFNKDKKVYIDVVKTNNYFMITIEDEGEGFDWANKIDNDVDYNNYDERGRGIIITKLCYDYIFYNKRGNMVSLIKLL